MNVFATRLTVVDLLPDPIRLHRVQMPRRKAELLGEVVIRRLRRDALVDERGERAASVGRDGDALPRRRAPADDAEDAFARERDAHGPADLARGHHAQLAVEPHRALAAEARRPRTAPAAVTFPFFKPKMCARLFAPPAVNWLVSNTVTPIVTLPDRDRRMRLDGVVVVGWRRERQVDVMRCRSQGRIRIALDDLR